MKISKKISQICIEQKIPVGVLEKILTLIDSLYDINNIQSCSIIGSVSKKVYMHGESDIDFLILTNSEFELEECISKLSDFGYDFIQSDDIYTYRFDRINFSLAFRIESEFVAYIDKILQAEYVDCIVKDWAIGAVIDEVMLNDVLSSVQCFDKSNCITEKKDAVRENASWFFVKLNQYLVIQFENKSNLALKYYERGNNFLFMFAFFESIAIYSRLYCTTNNLFHPSLKHLITKDEYLKFQEQIHLYDFDRNSFEIARAKKVIEKLRGDIFNE